MAGLMVLRDSRPAGDVLHWRLSGRTKVNVVGTATLQAATRQVRELAGDPRLRCVVLAGATAGSFIGGADLAELKALRAGTAGAFIRTLHDFCAALREFPVPVIARIAGPCLGGGLEIAAACDLRVAATDCRFGMPEVRVGVPSVIEAALLPQLIGWGRTRELLYRGHLIDAATAERIGLVEQLASPGALDTAVAAVVDEVLAGAPGAIRLQKQLIRAWEALPLEAAIEAGVTSFEQAYTTGEPAEYIERFFSGRHAAV